MTVDERLDAIAMRLEAIAGMHKANDKAIEKLTAKLDTLTERTIQVMDSISTLGRIAGLHEERLDQHEDDLEE